MAKILPLSDTRTRGGEEVADQPAETFAIIVALSLCLAERGIMHCCNKHELPKSHIDISLVTLSLANGM